MKNHFTDHEVERDNSFLEYIKDFIERILENNSLFVYTNPEFGQGSVGKIYPREDNIEDFKEKIHNRRDHDYTPFEAYDTQHDRIVAATFIKDYEGEGGGEIQHFIIRFYIVNNGKEVGSIVGKDGFVKTGKVEGSEVVSLFVQFPIEYSSWDSNDYDYTISDAQVVYPVYKIVPEFQSGYVIEKNDDTYNRIDNYDEKYGRKHMAKAIEQDKAMMKQYEESRKRFERGEFPRRKI